MLFSPCHAFDARSSRPVVPKVPRPHLEPENQTCPVCVVEALAPNSLVHAFHPVPGLKATGCTQDPGCDCGRLEHDRLRTVTVFPGIIPGRTSWTIRDDSDREAKGGTDQARVGPIKPGWDRSSQGG